MYMILCVIDQPEHLNQVLQAWKKNGIGGVTILESTGLHRLSEQPHIPMRYAFANTSAERGNVTLFTIVEKEETIRLCLQVTESIIGDMSGPNTGILVAWPLAFTKGVFGERAL